MSYRFLKLCVALLATLSLTLEANAQINVDLTPTVGIGASETLTFTASGPNSVAGLNFFLVIEDGGAAIGGAATDPPIVSFTPTGFFGASTPAFATSAPLATNGAFTLPTGVTAIPGAAPAPFAFLDVDTSSLSVGSTFAVSLAGALPAGSFNSEFLDLSGNPVATTFEGGQPFIVTVVGEDAVAAVPEPSSAAVLIAIGSLVAMRRKRS